MTSESTHYDTVIVGGGPAGIAAAMHLAFHHRKVLIVDRKTSPMQFANTPIHNYPGIKPLEASVDILQKLRKELRGFKVKTLFGNVLRIEGKVPTFQIHIKTTKPTPTTLTAKTIILATGISRKHPKVDGDWKQWLPYAAKDHMSYYCPDCDSPLTKGKDIIIVNAGTAKSALHVARCIKPYAKRIRIFMTEDGYAPFTKEFETILSQSGFDWTHGLIQEVKILEPGLRQQLLTSDGRILECNAFFVAWIGVPRSELALSIGIEVDERQSIITDQRGATNIEGIWAAGDVRPITQSLATAVGTGVYAAIMIAHYLMNLG
ncbi:MAG: NAD(P)/FAD-dependent oxidoreductase [Candidatus Hermodarchaeia archaeon]